MYFEELVKKLSQKLKGIAYKLHSRYAYFNVDDLYQEALVRLWMYSMENRPAKDTDSYILQGCYFHLMNYIRNNQEHAYLISLENMVNREDEVFNAEDILFPREQDSILENINAQMIIEEINNNGLTKREKQVFNLAIEGMTTREIGEKLGISHVRVVRLKSRIKDKCRIHLDKKE